MISASAIARSAAGAADTATAAGAVYYIAAGVQSATQYGHVRHTRAQHDHAFL